MDMLFRPWQIVSIDPKNPTDRMILCEDYSAVLAQTMLPIIDAELAKGRIVRLEQAAEALDNALPVV